MSNYLAPGKLPGILKLVVLALIALTLGGLPMAASADDASSSAAAADASASAPAAPPAPPPIDPKAVVATIGGEQIVEADLGFEAQQLGDQVSQIPPDQVRAVLLSQVIATKLIAQAAKAQKLDQSDDYKLFLPYLADEVLRQSLENSIATAVTAGDIKAEFDKEIAAMPTQDEVHAEHILLDKSDLAKAQDLKKQIDGGASFEDLAKANSIDTGSAAQGGDVGWFTADKMVAEFATAAFALKVGQVSDPVQSQFGWHIIKVLGRRPAAKPTIDQLAPDISKKLAQQKFQALFQQLLKAATIDIPDAALKTQVQAQMSAQAGDASGAAPDAGQAPAPDASAASSSAQ